MVNLTVPKIECVESKDNFGRFVAEPMEKGVGVTVGNALRRILLSYLPGAAVTSVKIEGIQHEFSTIPHAKEDTLEFLLNVKEMRLMPISGQPGKLVLEVQGEGRVTAADIQPSADFEIVNPEMFLMTLDSPEARLYIEFNVEMGAGYKQAEYNANLPVGVIPVDAIFTPIRKVNFTVEQVHVGQETGRERLVLEIWTDGTISPTDALSRGAGLLMEQLSPFVDYAKVAERGEAQEAIRSTISDEKYNMPVDQLDLSVRTMNSLRRAGITTVGELVAKEEKELLSLRNFGQKSMGEVKEKLVELGLSLAGKEEVGKEEPSEEKT